MSEIVIYGIPFGTPAESDALRQVKDLGFTAVQIYTHWRMFEGAGRGKFDWSWTDGQVEAIQKAGLKYVPFMLMGPFYSAPEWWLKSPDHVDLRCLEHDKPCPIESIWNTAFYWEIARVQQAFAAHYLPWNVIESVQPGICGDYGESLFPAVGNWPGTYHTHRGYWCGGADARASYRHYLQTQYATLDALNRQWRTAHASFDAIDPVMPHRCASRSQLFDQMSWYRRSMTDYCDVWMAECRRAYPQTPIYLCAGGADDENTSGTQFAEQAKVVARHGGGIRLTNEANTFAYNYPLTSHTHAACEFYGAYLGLEPVGPITEQGVTTRMFGSAAFGNRQVFHYYGNLFDKNRPLPAAQSVKKYAPLIRQQPSEHGVAVFWPIDQATINGSLTGQSALHGDLSATLLHVRRQYPAAAVSEALILDGILSRYKLLVMIGVASARSAVLERIARWVRDDGGILLTTTRTADIELQYVPAFDAALGFTAQSEDACGHHHQTLQLPDGFPHLAALTGYHADHGWLELAEGTEILSVAQAGKTNIDMAGVTRVHPVSTLFRRRWSSGGQAIYYGGAICFQSDPQALFDNPTIIVKLLDDVCTQTGLQPLGTQSNELARARIGGKLLILRDGAIDIQTQPSLKTESAHT